MGVGSPPSVIEAVRRGIDMFDCVMPTRVGRTGTALTDDAPINLRQAQYVDDLSPIESGCPCMACRHYSRAYLRHLFKAGEMLGPRLVSLHNLAFMGASWRPCARRSARIGSERGAATRSHATRQAAARKGIPPRRRTHRNSVPAGG